MTFRLVGVTLAAVAALAFGSGRAQTPPCTPASGGASAVSGLPLPKACPGAAPAGAAANLRVLPWAGFKGAVSYTFDDASPSQIQHYDTLNAPGVRVTFYVVPNHVQRTDPDGVSLVDRWRAVLDDGHELGSHTINHCSTDADGALSGCVFGTPEESVNTAALQIQASNDYVTDTLGQVDALGNPAVWSMASPFGDADYDAFAIAAGLLAHRDVWTNQPGSFLAAGAVNDIHHLPCFAGGGASGGWGVDEQQSTFEKIVNDARGRGRWTVLLFHGVAPTDWDTQSPCCPVPATAIAGSMEHLKAWGDVWGDSVVNVASYTIAQNLFASLTPTTAGGATTWTWTLPANYPPGKHLRVAVDGGALTQSIEGSDVTLPWNERGFYEVALSAGNLTLHP